MPLLEILDDLLRDLLVLLEQAVRSLGLEGLEDVHRVALRYTPACQKRGRLKRLKTNELF